VKYLLQAMAPLVRDFLSTIAFLITLSLVHDTQTAILVGIGVGLAEFAWEFARHRKIGLMQGASLFLVIALGGASLITRDPRFVMIKPSIGYAAIGVVMLRPGWQTPYIPQIARDLVPEGRFVFWGYAWAALMLSCAVANLVLAATVDIRTWAYILLVGGIGTKAVLFLAEFVSVRLEAGRTARRRRAAVGAA